MLKNRDSIEDGYALYHSVGHRPNGSQEMAAAVSDFSLMWTAPIPEYGRRLYQCWRSLGRVFPRCWVQVRPVKKSAW